jgi:hypothetical protein
MIELTFIAMKATNEDIMWTSFLAACVVFILLAIVSMIVADFTDDNVQATARGVYVTGDSEPSYDPTIDGSIYTEVTYMLGSDSIMDIHAFWGVEPPTDYDWVETAFSLGIPVDCLTIDMYMDHLEHGASSKYVRNRACR